MAGRAQKTFRLLLSPVSFRAFQPIDKGLMLQQGLVRSLTSGEAFTALKPFFFAVHPDLFGQFPKERAVNENSLKQLNAYIEASTTLSDPVQSAHLTFYLRNGNANAAANPSVVKIDGQFQSVRVVLRQKDVRKTVHSILETCNLPTAYIDNLPATTTPKYKHSRTTHKSPHNYTYETTNYTQDYYWSKKEDMEDVERDIKNKANAHDSLRTWVERNVVGATSRLKECSPIREEIERLKETVCKTIGVFEIRWDCGWGTQHFRGCLQSLLSLANHHPENMEILKGKTIIFGRDTGISLDGHVILSSGEVRANWLDLIKRANRHNVLISKIPSVEKALSTALKDISVVHRKFEPTRMADSYESNLRKLITSIGDYKGRCSFPAQWPKTLTHLELVVESDSGPLMLSPTGQIIVPSSCPPFLLVNFITERMEEAGEKLALYKKQKYEERDLHALCMKELGLLALEKADNITPNLMIDCLSRLLSRSQEFKSILQGTHLWITTYYSVQSDGEMCIPWNWK